MSKRRTFKLEFKARILYSDQGIQYAATDYTARMPCVGVQISMVEVGESAQNG
jgi:transposase InsO family protein